MTAEWSVLIAAFITGMLALAGSGMAIYFSINERRAQVDNLDAETVKTNVETIKLMQETASHLRLRVDNLEAELGEEKALRRKDRKTFDDKISTLKKQHESEIADIKSKYDYEIKALELRVKELEDELARAEKSRAKAQEERDEARQENHTLLEENYQLRQQIAAKGK